MALLYLVPVAIAAALFPKPITAAMSAFTSTIWFLADFYAHSSPMRQYSLLNLIWIGVIRLGTLSIFSYLVVKTRDAISAREQSAAELRRLNQELEQRVSDRTAELRDALDEMEHFSYAIVHDMRAPLRAMISFADLADRDLANHNVDQTFIHRIKTAARRMDRLITDALSFSKAVRNELPLSQVNLGIFLHDLIETYPNLGPDTADIGIEMDLPVVLGNEAGLTQCFGNLLDNAIKFAKPGAKPEIRIWAESVHVGTENLGKPISPAKTIHRSIHPGVRASLRDSASPFSSTEDFVRIWVTDNGIGIPTLLQSKVFGMFQRGHNNQPGTGIGLAIVRKVVERMGGQVGVESQEGVGSKFWVELHKASNPKLFA